MMSAAAPDPRPPGSAAGELIVATGLAYMVPLDPKLWLAPYLRYRWQRAWRGPAAGTAPVPPQRDKYLLQEVDLVIGMNEFVLLAGSSGSSKTTLMHILSTVKYPSQGDLFYKGRSYKEDPEVLRPHIGYVPQDDILHVQLSVFDELVYAAELRLPELSRTERETRIREVLQQLGLEPQIRQRIDKLSGGQRKRVNVAVELLSRPVLLFLDEPTEGQDAHLEQEIIKLLRNLANGGTSVLLVSHRLNFLNYVDYVGWLAPGGHLAYFGPPDQVADYFAVDPGLPPTHRYAEIYKQLGGAAVPRQLALDYKSSPLYREVVRNRQQIPAQAGPTVPAPVKSAGGASAWLRQFRTLYRRDWAVVRADWYFLVLMIFQAPILGLLLHSLTPSSLDPLSNAIAIEVSIFALLLSALWLGICGSMLQLVTERPIYQRERMVGLEMGPYLASKIAVLSTFSVYQSLILVAAIFTAAPLADKPGVFLPIPLEMFLTALLTSYCGMMLGLLLSALAQTKEVVLGLVPLAILPQVFLSKSFHLLLNWPLDWLAKLTFTNWSLEALGDSLGLTGNDFAGAAAHAEYDPTNPPLVGHWFVLLALIGGMLAIIWARQSRRDMYQASVTSSREALRRNLAQAGFAADRLLTGFRDSVRKGARRTAHGAQRTAWEAEHILRQVKANSAVADTRRERDARIFDLGKTVWQTYEAGATPAPEAVPFYEQIKAQQAKIAQLAQELERIKQEQPPQSAPTPARYTPTPSSGYTPAGPAPGSAAPASPALGSEAAATATDIAAHDSPALTAPAGTASEDAVVCANCQAPRPDPTARFCKRCGTRYR